MFNTTIDYLEQFKMINNLYIFLQYSKKRVVWGLTIEIQIATYNFIVITV